MMREARRRLIAAATTVLLVWVWVLPVYGQGEMDSEGLAASIAGEIAQDGTGAECRATVTLAEEPIIRVEEIQLQPETLIVEVGEAVKLEYYVLPANAVGTLTWESSDTAVATVSDSMVTAQKAGTASIYARQDGVTAECKVTVLPVNDLNIEVTSIQLQPQTLALTEGETATLTAIVTPANAAGTVRWQSDNHAVAVVANSVVTAKKPGTAKIYADQGGKQTTCTVTVAAVQSKPGSGPTDEKPSPVKEEPKEPKDPVDNLVYRTYHATLNRDPDDEGFDYWTGRLRNNTLTGADLVSQFFLSTEFARGSHSNKEYVSRVYQAMMGRQPDAEGSAHWVGCLEGGVSRAWVLQGFLGSEEFALRCRNAGVEVGSLALEETRDRSPDLTRFVNRLYTHVLNRPGEADGLNHWCAKGLEESYSAYQLAESFVFSQEFEDMGHSNESYVKVLYRAFMGREAETNGQAYWVKALDSGEKDRRAVFHGFASSEEFRQISQNFGVKPV